MPNFLVDFLQSTAEYQNWGEWNIVIVSFWGTVFLTLLQWRGMWQQNRLIWKNHSGEAFSTPLTIFTVSFFATFFCYGWIIKSLAPVINGSLALPFLTALLGLKKFKGFRKTDWILIVFYLSLIPAIIILPYPKTVMSINIFSTFIFLLLQLAELVKSPSRGVLGGEYILSFLASYFFWSTYGISIGDPIISTGSPTMLIMWSVTGLVWLKKPEAGFES